MEKWPWTQKLDMNNWGSNLTLKGHKENVTENYSKIVFFLRKQK